MYIHPRLVCITFFENSYNFPAVFKVNTGISIPTNLLPVMVFIHWGGFFAGYSSTDYLGPDYFMDKNIVLVTFNYRLGVLGKTSLEVKPK